MASELLITAVSQRCLLAITVPMPMFPCHIY